MRDPVDIDTDRHLDALEARDQAWEDMLAEHGDQIAGNCMDEVMDALDRTGDFRDHVRSWLNEQATDYLENQSCDGSGPLIDKLKELIDAETGRLLT